MCNPVWSCMRCMQGDDRTAHCGMYAFSLQTQADAFPYRMCLLNYLIQKYLFKLQKVTLVCMKEKQKLERFF